MDKRIKINGVEYSQVDGSLSDELNLLRKENEKLKNKLKNIDSRAAKLTSQKVIDSTKDHILEKKIKKMIDKLNKEINVRSEGSIIDISERLREAKIEVLEKLL
jgi:sugar-specific transcriptional regulator TrmB